MSSYVNYGYNMDNILVAMLTLFSFSTLEGWNDYVYKFMDGTLNGP
jgi:hypothetical protein